MSSLEKQARTNVGKKLIKFIEENPDKRWSWYSISRNPNITMEIIEANPDKDWDWWEISSNRFQGEYKKELERLKQRKQLIHNRYAFRKQIGLGM